MNSCRSRDMSKLSRTIMTELLWVNWQSSMEWSTRHCVNRLQTCSKHLNCAVMEKANLIRSYSISRSFSILYFQEYFYLQVQILFIYCSSKAPGCKKLFEIRKVLDVKNFESFICDLKADTDTKKNAIYSKGKIVWVNFQILAYPFRFFFKFLYYLFINCCLFIIVVSLNLLEPQSLNVNRAYIFNEFRNLSV